MKVWVWINVNETFEVSPKKPERNKVEGHRCWCGLDSCLANTEGSVTYSHEDSITICCDYGKKLFGKLDKGKLYRFELTADEL